MAFAMRLRFALVILALLVTWPLQSSEDTPAIPVQQIWLRTGKVCVVPTAEDRTTTIVFPLGIRKLSGKGFTAGLGKRVDLLETANGWVSDDAGKAADFVLSLTDNRISVSPLHSDARQILYVTADNGTTYSLEAARARVGRACWAGPRAAMLSHFDDRLGIDGERRLLAEDAPELTDRVAGVLAPLTTLTRSHSPRPRLARRALARPSAAR